MPTITARTASDKISEIRSKLAIYDVWKQLVHANYLAGDGGEAESRVYRADGATVTEDHFHAVLEDVDEVCDELRKELAEWEGLTFQPKEADIRPLRPANDDEPVRTKRIERSKGAARRLQPATAK